jgi:hypothetical protein
MYIVKELYKRDATIAKLRGTCTVLGPSWIGGKFVVEIDGDRIRTDRIDHESLTRKIRARGVPYSFDGTMTLLERGSPYGDLWHTVLKERKSREKETNP